MAKFRIAVVAGIAAVYPFGQQHASHTLKEGQGIDLEIGPEAEPKMAEVAGVLGLIYDKIKADLGAPAAGVDTDAPFGKRDGTLEVTAVDGAVTLRVYEGSNFSEELLAEGDSAAVEVTETNRITLAVYEAQAAPK